MTNVAAASLRWRIILTDLAVLGAAYGLPSLSHIAPFPLYYLDPMRLLLLTAYLLTTHRGNAVLLAATIPLFSTWVTGHPPFAKALLIGMELVVNITLLHAVLGRWKQPVILKVLGTIVVSKVVYYTAKALFIWWGWLQDKVIATGLDTQLITAVALSCFFALIYRRKA